MPKYIKNYKDKQKARATRNRERRKYYQKLDFGVNRKEIYTEDEKDLIKAHTMPDREIAKQLGRSVLAIQVYRSRLMKREREAENGIG